VTTPLLLLWDIDGTLLQRASMEHADAMRRALIDVHGSLELDGHHVEAAGRTDGAIARDLLLAAGLAGPAIDSGSDDVITAACALYDELCPPDLSPRLAPGIADVLPRLAARPDAFRFSLVTGNFERIARLKLARAGIGDWFPEGQGAFGSDAEDRNELVPVALRRAGGWPPARTVVVGDAPGDVACALAGGAFAVALTGHFDVRALDGAHAFIGDLGELAAALAGLPAP
jgi:phosphoglycolate phosphatase